MIIWFEDESDRFFAGRVFWVNEPDRRSRRARGAELFVYERLGDYDVGFSLTSAWFERGAGGKWRRARAPKGAVVDSWDSFSGMFRSSDGQFDPDTLRREGLAAYMGAKDVLEPMVATVVAARARRNPRRNPKVTADKLPPLRWGYGVKALAVLRAEGQDIPLRLIVQASDARSVIVVTATDPGEEPYLLVAADGRMIHKSGLFEIGELMISYYRARKLPLRAVRPLHRLLMANRDTMRRRFRAVGWLSEGRAELETEAFNLMDVRDVERAVIAGFEAMRPRRRTR